ncbi:hypothetical protein E2C01_021949 [Portunus trituberculatus]|uniref:Uncharacterized protein n=1 Tax=Portunus trituberculatus TaxID=210409 RepID=A0A5B7E5Q5_PORTR|nr:hypothetical protein [Portunus trituberculatus]
MSPLVRAGRGPPTAPYCKLQAVNEDEAANVILSMEDDYQIDSKEEQQYSPHTYLAKTTLPEGINIQC